MQSRAGGENIVDDDIARDGVDGQSFGDDEGPGDVFPAFLPAEPGLRDGLVLLAKQRFGPTSGYEGGEPLSDPFGLIITAVTSPGVMQGDRDQDGPGQMAAEDLVFHGRRGQVVGQERAALILNAVDDPPGGAAGAEGADRPAESGPEVEAVGAGPVTL